MPGEGSHHRKRRANEREDSEADNDDDDKLKINHRLFSFPRGGKQRRGNKAQQSNNKSLAAAQQQQQSEEEPAPPSIGVLDGITRGSIANMVLARLGKLNPSELIGPAPSKPPQVANGDEEHEENDEEEEGEESEDYNNEEDGEDGSQQQDRDKTGAGATSATKASSPSSTAAGVGSKGKMEETITFFDRVRPQPPTLSLKRHQNNFEGTYTVQSGPYFGARGTLHPIATFATAADSNNNYNNKKESSSTLGGASGFCILQTEDGRVATVHESQVNKSTPGLPRNAKLRKYTFKKEDKTLFLNDVQRFLA